MAGCSGTSSHPTGHPSTSQSAAAVEAWRLSGLEPVGQPIAVAGQVVLYVTDKKHLYLMAVDPAKGAVRWKHEAALSGIPGGISMSPSAVGQRVTYLRGSAKDDHFAEIVVADARTGADVAVSPERMVAEPPRSCHDETAVCASTSDGSSAYSLHQLQIANGRFLPDSSSGSPVAGREVGPDGLTQLYSVSPETVALAPGGNILWRLPVSMGFPPGFSHSHGWAWHSFQDHRILVGSLGSSPGGTAAGWRSDLGRRFATAGLDQSTGAVLWRETGTWVGCTGALLWAVAPDVGQYQAAVRCRYTGVQVATIRAGNVALSYPQLDVAIEGFDPRSGHTTWALKAGNAPSLIGSGRYPVRTGEVNVLIQTGTGSTLLDLRNGERTTPPTGSTYWCQTDREFAYFQPTENSNGVAMATRNGGSIASICDADGKPAKTIPPLPSAKFVGASVGPVTVVALEDALVAYRASAS